MRLYLNVKLVMFLQLPVTLLRDA